MISLENQPPCPSDIPQNASAWNFGGSRASPKFDGFIVAFGGGWEGADDYSKK